MTLPPSYRSPEIDRLAALVWQISATELFKFPHLSHDVVLMLGAFIQYYNFIDLNLRRSIEVFSAANILPLDFQKRHLKLPASELVAAAKSAVQIMDAVVEDIPEALGKFDEIELRR